MFGIALTDQNSIPVEITVTAGCSQAVLVVIRYRIFCVLFAVQNIQTGIYRTAIWCVVLCGCETWSLALREERRVRVLGGMFGAEWDKVTGEWRKLHNEELNNLYCSPLIVRVIRSRRMSWAGHVARIGEISGAYIILVGRPQGNRPLR